MKTDLFSEEELQSIEKAVEQVESQFPVEIVPVFASASNDYAVVSFRASIIGLLTGYLGIVLLTYLDFFALTPFFIKGLAWIIWVLFVLVLFEWINPLKRLLIGKANLVISTEERAKQEYLNQEVYRNPDRIGVLIFVSFFERRFHILSDPKGSAILNTKKWESVAANFSSELKNIDKHTAIIHCIENCGEALSEIEFDSTDLPPSILPNKLRVED